MMKKIGVDVIGIKVTKNAEGKLITRLYQKQNSQVMKKQVKV